MKRRDRATARSRSATDVISNALPLQRLVDAHQFDSIAMIASERPRFKAVKLLDRLELNTRTAAIAFEVAGADVVIAVPTIRHLRPQLGIGALQATMKTKNLTANFRTRTQIRITTHVGFKPFILF